LLSGILGVVTTLVLPPSGQAQRVCRRPDSTSAALIAELARYSSATRGGDLVVRDSLRLPATPAAQLRLAQLERVCTKANTAYRRRRENTGGTGFSDRVYVISIGRTSAVLDPGLNYGQPGNWTVVILDRKFQPLAVY
jgi:hypothetical protein